MGLVRRLIHAGVDDRLAESDRKHVVLLNELALAICVMNAIALTSPDIWDHPLELIGLSVQGLGVLIALPLNARRRYFAARLWTLGVGMLTAVGIAWLEGPASERELYCVDVIVAAWLIFPSRERAWAVGASLLAVALTALLGTVDLPGGGVYAPDASFAHELQRQTRIALPLFVWLFGAYGARRTQETEARLELERARNEELLLNTLPAPIVKRLKAGETAIADRVDAATVLFADLVNFTVLSERMPATRLVAMLDDVFSRFDAIADAYGLEKIKTIGDAYMVAGGVPEARADHAEAVAVMALEMQRTLRELGDEYRALELRIGIHTGPVVAGVIGKRKLVYDLWGDTVNTASRMESHGVAGKIQVSLATHDALDGRFTMEPRGTISVKGKGELPTWFLVGDARPHPGGARSVPSS